MSIEQLQLQTLVDANVATEEQIVELKRLQDEQQNPAADDDASTDAQTINQTEVEAALEKVSFIHQNEQTASLLTSFFEQQKRFIPLIENSALQDMLAVSQLANAYCKGYHHTLAYKVTDKTMAELLVGIRCALDFDAVISDREDSYQIQVDKLKSPYATHGIVTDGTMTNSPFRSHSNKADIKHGSTFIATTGELQYVHAKQPSLVAYVKDNIEFVKEDVKRENFTKINPKTDIGILMHKVLRQNWRDDLNSIIKEYLSSKEIDELTADLVAETAKAWKPFLVIAKMISDEVFKNVYSVMLKYTAQCSLPDIFKVCVAIKLALPPFKALIEEYGFQRSLNQKLIDKWLDHYGQKLSPSLTKKVLDDAQLKSESNQFCFGVNTTGYKIADLENLVATTLGAKPERVESLENAMREHAASTKKAEVIKAA
ncbi:hypothetical protein [Acinetobacter lactucae]|uniref:hypothetical protein n=1 Tax=Acinetobacter lactucae TaxID=1785128 RepID=UPI00124CEF79|nr:hypothetical protein [Acinetobacter lactucae]